MAMPWWERLEWFGKCGPKFDDNCGSRPFQSSPAWDAPADGVHACIVLVCMQPLRLLPQLVVGTRVQATWSGFLVLAGLICCWDQQANLLSNPPSQPPCQDRLDVRSLFTAAPSLSSRVTLRSVSIRHCHLAQSPGSGRLSILRTLTETWLRYPVGASLCSLEPTKRNEIK